MIVLKKDQKIERSLDSRWDGTNVSAPEFDAAVQAELRHRGGYSYLRFYTGDYGSEQFEKFLRTTFKGIWFTAELANASFDEPTAEEVVLYPPRYLEFVHMFIDGAIHISHEKCNYSVKQMRKFMSEGDRCLFGHLCDMTLGAGAPYTLIHSMYGKPGSLIRSKLFENFLCQPESSATNFAQLHGAFICDQHSTRPYPFTLTENIRSWIAQYKIIRCGMARQLDYEEAKAGCLPYGDASFLAFVRYAADRVRNNGNGVRKPMHASEIARILMIEWQAYIKIAANSKPILEVRPDKYGQASSPQSPYGRFAVTRPYPYYWDEQASRFLDNRTASGIELISSEEEKESDSEVESGDENEMTKSQSNATGKVPKVRNGSKYDNRIDATHEGRDKRSAQQYKTGGQKKSRTEKSGK